MKNCHGNDCETTREIPIFYVQPLVRCSSAMSLSSLFVTQVRFKTNYFAFMFNFINRQPKSNHPSVQVSKGAWKSATIKILSLLLLLSDSCAGVLLATYISRHRTRFDEYMVEYTYGAVNLTRNSTKWLMGNPAGLKLNEPLTEYLGSTIHGAVSAWSILFERFLFAEEAYFDAVWFLLYSSSFLGFTVFLAFLLDLGKISVGYVLTLYNIFARLHSVQFSTLMALIRLFIGKKWNPLRKRTDSYEYNQSQLIVGTLLFSMLLFLLPTTLVYYALFVILKLVTSCIRFTGSCLIVAINHFIIFGPLWFDQLFKFNFARVTFKFNNLKLENQLDANIFVYHNLFPKKSMSLEDFKIWTSGVDDTVIANEYFDKQPTLHSLPTNLRNSSLLYCCLPSLTSRLKYLITCVISGEILDF